MKTILAFLCAIDRAVSIAVRTICAVSLTAIFVMFLLNVFVRFVPIYNFTQTDDWIQFFLIWMIFLGASELVRTKSHFIVDVLTEKLKGTVTGRFLALVVSVIEGVCYALICYFGVVWVMKANAYMQSIPWMQMKWAYAAIPVSAFFMTCYGIRNVIEAALELARGGDSEHH